MWVLGGRWGLGCALVTVVINLGCSSGGGGGGNASADPVQACMDTADAIAKAEMRCGLPFVEARAASIQVAAKGDCGNILQVRDEAALRSICIPSLASITCLDLAAGNLDPSCSGQLQRLASVPLDVSPAPSPAAALMSRTDL